jgi:hypothetical protein
MRFLPAIILGASIAAALASNLDAAPAAAPAGKNPQADSAAAPTNVIPRSVFNVPASPKEGRDPFFPTSVGAADTGSSTKKSSSISTVALVLKGLSGTPEQRLAIINDRTVAEGEEADVSTGGGRVRIRCIQIKSDSVVIEVAGERRELHLRD